MSDFLPATISDVGHELAIDALDDEGRRSMVIIAQTSNLPFEPTLETLLRALPPEPAQQVRDACVVLLTEPSANYAQFLKFDALPGENLVVHKAAIG